MARTPDQPVATAKSRRRRNELLDAARPPVAPGSTAFEVLTATITLDQYIAV